MKITKTARETVYHKSVVIHSLDVNGRKVRVESIVEQDAQYPMNDESEVNILDEDTLTAEEVEAIDAHMNELLNLSPDESTEV